MIDKEARKSAVSISRGESPEAATDSKIALYGLLARALDTVTLDGGIILKEKPTNFNVLEFALRAKLIKSAKDGFFNLDSATRNEIHELLSERIEGARNSVGGLALTGLTRLMQGCGTGAHVEIVTLRTIAQNQLAGHLVSEDGIYSSGKVPFALAMLHFKDLLVYQKLFDRWSESDGGDGEDVFWPNDVTLDFYSGLSFTNKSVDLAVTKQKIAHGPQIGCPVTLVKGYTRKIHEITAECALESGLVTVF